MIKTADGFKDYLEEHFGPLDNLGMLAELAGTVEELMQQPSTALFMAVTSAVDEMQGTLRDIVRGLRAQDGLLDGDEEADEEPDECDESPSCAECLDPLLAGDATCSTPCGEVHRQCYAAHLGTCRNCSTVATEVAE